MDSSSPIMYSSSFENQGLESLEDEGFPFEMVPF